MGENTTAMRDPVFYKWHSSINDMFDAYKQTLTPYTTDQVSRESFNSEIVNLLLGCAMYLYQRSAAGDLKSKLTQNVELWMKKECIL